MPAQLKEVRNRIGAVKNTQKITKAMKLVAASKLRRAQERITQMRPYSVKLNDMLSNIASGSEGNANIVYASERAPEKVLLVAVTSDKGLCGGFNSSISKLAKSVIAERYSEQKAAGNVEVMIIGKKSYDVLKKEEDLTFNLEHIDLFNRLTFDNVAEVAEYVMDSFIDKKYDVVEILYNQFKNQVTQIAVSERFLPITKLESDDAETAKVSKAKSDFIYQPSQAAIIEELVPKILKTQFFRNLLDSNASEHGARMTAMANATENAEELLRDLKIMYNRARQAAITTELTEIVSGAAALQG